MYKLQNNVHIVSGAKHHCIYNLNSRKLYHLDSEHLEYLHQLASEAYKNVPVTVRDFFIKEDIVIADKSKLVEEICPYLYGKNIDFVWIEITQRCNLYCRHCYEGSSKNVEISDMTMQDFETAVNALHSIDIKRIQLVGGEPLIHPQIAEMIKIAKDTFEFVEVYTNGTLLTDELLELITDRKVALAFSLYAADSAVHDYVTCTKGSYDLTKDRICKAMDLGNTVRVASVEMKDIPRYVFDDKRAMARADLPRVTGRAGLHLYSRDMLRRKLITKETFRKPVSADDFLRNQKVHNCFGARLYIDCKLDVYPCVMERRLTYGNIKEIPITKMLGMEPAFLTKDKIKGCKDCEFRYACFDCRPDSNGNEIYDKPWYCTYDPQEGIWADVEEFMDGLLKNS